MSDIGNSWYSYTFGSEITTVNLIFSNNGSPQTVDITGVSQSTCYQTSGLSGSNITVSTSECVTTDFTTPKESNYIINSTNKNVVLSDISGKSIKVFDIFGRTVFEISKAQNSEQFNVNNSGVYIIAIDNFKKKILIN